MQAAYGGVSRLAAVASDCNQTVKPLRFTMSLLLILTVITAIIIIATAVYNWLGKIEAGDKQNEQMAAKKKWINIGLYTSIATSILAVCATLYALPNVNKMISCPATA